MNLLRKVDAMKSIEWYDGIVTGLIQFQDDVFLCVLLALDVSDARRCYLLVQVASTSFPAVAFGDVGEFFRSTLKDAVDKKMHLYIATDEPLQGRDLILREADGIQLSHLTSMQFPRIDEAVLGTSISKWL